MPPTVAVIWDVPFATAVASPVDPAAFEIVATDSVPEVQMASPVSSTVVWSDSVPVATNCSLVPVAMVGLAGVTSIDTSTGAVTVKEVEPVTPW